MTISIAALIAPVTKSWNYRGTAPSREVASRDSASFSQHLPHLNRRRANARWPTPVCETRASTEDNFEVFRFTLGVDFLDDEDIPRVAGLFCAAFLFVNHFASGNAPVAQARTEITSTLLACACITTPLIGRRLLEASPGKIGEETGIVGGEEFFTFSSDVSDETRAEIAWATYTFLTQTNGKSVIIIDKGAGDVLCARGSLCIRSKGQGPTLREDKTTRLTTIIKSSGLKHVAQRGTLYLKDRNAFIKARADAWEFLPPGAESVFIYTGIGKILVLLISDQPNAFSKKQRSRVMAVADKLSLISF